MPTIDELGSALIKADAAGNAGDAKVFADEIRKMRAAETPQAVPSPPSARDAFLNSLPADRRAAASLPVKFGQEGAAAALAEERKSHLISSTASDISAGLFRGAGSIGATLNYPIDKITDLIKGDRKNLPSRNEERRAGIDGGLRELGANTDSLGYKGGKLAGEIAGTAGVGGVLAKAVPLISQAPRALQFANGLRTGGLSLGTPAATTLAGRAGDLGLRSLAGATGGGASVGLINPNDAGTGAVIGAALPPALKTLGIAGGAAKRLLSGPSVAEPLRKAVESARGAGYVIPPTQAKPTFLNRALEGFSGKISTAQNASARNQPITQALVAKELGLPAGTPVSLDALKTIRSQAGDAYEAVSSAGVINTTPAYNAALDKITASAKQAASGFPGSKANPLIAEIESLKSPQFDASSAVAKIKELRGTADSAYASGNKELGKALKDGAAAIEDAIEVHLKTINAPQSLLSGFRDARQLIAKTYSVEKAMNVTTGNIDAVKLGNQLARGRPLSGGIRDVAAFAQQFPKAAQSVERMGSLPQTSPLDWIPASAMAMGTGNPLLLAGVAARPLARSAALSGPVQRGLLSTSTNDLQDLLANPELQKLLYRSAPVIAPRN